jgi:hypothetical protein
MACQIQINSISGTSPFDIYMCDIGLAQCVYLQTETSPTYPIIITYPPTLEGATSFIIKIIDANGLELFKPYTQPSPTPSISVTPTITPSPTIGLSATPTPTVTPTPSNNNTNICL